MAKQGGIQYLEKVNRLLSRQNGKPVLKPNRALILKDKVANRKVKKGGKSVVSLLSKRLHCGERLAVKMYGSLEANAKQVRCVKNKDSVV